MVSPEFKRRSLLTAISLLLSSTLVAQDVASARPVTDERLQNPEPENWLQFRGNYNGWGYSPLDDIDRKSVV
jgi:alcohol dehydrogenase (cytochrome c)